jgi:hypothetical protein
MYTERDQRQRSRFTVHPGVHANADAFRKALCRSGILRELCIIRVPHPVFFKAIQI